MRRTVPWKLLGTLLWLAACRDPGSGPGEPDPGSEPVSVASSPLVNAQLDPGDPAVGITGACTATLIGRKTALTAAHCGSNHASHTQLLLYPCGNSSCERSFFGIFLQHPSYTGEGDFDHDIGIILFSDDITAQTGIVPRRIGSTPAEDNQIYLVGYGRTDPNVDSFGQKHSGYNTIGDIHSETIDYDDTSQSYGANGDSGGPAFIPGSDCELGVYVGDSNDCFLFFCDLDYELTRLDTKQAWIQGAAHDPTVHGCSETSCGDGLCQGGEWCGSCPGDCGACPAPVCGDHSCNGSESCTSCPGDCGQCPPTCRAGTDDCCGDGVCRSPLLCQKVGC